VCSSLPNDVFDLLGLLPPHTARAAQGRALLLLPGLCQQLDSQALRLMCLNSAAAACLGAKRVAWGAPGSSQDGYAKGLCAAAYAAGYRPAVLNYRCSPAPSSLFTHCPCKRAPHACCWHARPAQPQAGSLACLAACAQAVLGAGRGQAGAPGAAACHRHAGTRQHAEMIQLRMVVGLGCSRFSKHARRGCGGVPLDSPATFSAAFTGDAHFAADELQRRRFPGAPLLLAGFSMGALQAAKLLAELGAGERELSARRPALRALPCRRMPSGVPCEAQSGLAGQSGFSAMSAARHYQCAFGE